jgi:hypothetical protein
MPIVLSISHNIFLTEEERQRIYAHEPLEVLGVSVPVWFYRGSTSEPASEVFCKYVLTNIEEDYPITVIDSGYRINLPQIPKDYKPRNLPRNWSLMTPHKQMLWTKKYPEPISCENLIVDGLLTFKRYVKTIQFEKKTTVVHTVEIRHMETLISSLS